MKLCLFVLFNFVCFFASAQDGLVPKNIYDIKMAGANGIIIDLSKYAGKKILIVNTPIEADNARQYSELEALYKKENGKLIIIGVLANDFSIEPGSNKSNLPQREKNYNVTFPLAAKQMVRGNLSPLYTWLTMQKYNNLQDTEVKWDFQKYLISENGTLIAEFDPKIRPNDPKLVAAIEK